VQNLENVQQLFEMCFEIIIHIEILLFMKLWLEWHKIFLCVTLLFTGNEILVQWIEMVLLRIGIQKPK
jgi:hypothetical protein